VPHFGWWPRGHPLQATIHNRDLAEHAEPPFLGDFYRKVAERYWRMAKEALDLADAEARRKD
jgi:hypothetical protein